MTRNGKIARLPSVLREQLNRRIADGEHGKKLVEWRLPGPVQQVVFNPDGTQLATANSNVNRLSTPRLRQAKAVWIIAVPVNQGISDPFSTGSQPQ